MIKRILLLLLAAMALLTASCMKIPVPQPETESPETWLTSPNGDEIPSYENVNRAVLDPALFQSDEKGRMYYADAGVATYTGVDVSVFQGEIDWDAVKNDGVDFAMLRVGYRGYGSAGKLGADDLFLDNYAAATAAGLQVGVYFFSQATSAEEAREEADFVLEQIRGLRITFPVAYDWEHIDYDSARTDSMTGAEISACAAAFCEEISAAGYHPLIYFNRETGYFNYDLSRVSDYHFWLAEYLSAPSFVYDYKIWQYTKTGTVDGISGSVDLNLSLFDYSGTGSLG